MACHLLLKNNTVSLSQPVKRKQSQNRENMHNNSFLTYDERQTAFSKNYGYLISTEYWLTFYKYYIVFWTAFIASRVSPLSGEEKRRRPGGYTFEWGLEMKQYSKATGQRVCKGGSDRQTWRRLKWITIAGLHLTSQQPYWWCVRVKNKSISLLWELNPIFM